MGVLAKSGDSFCFKDTGEVITPKYIDYTCPEDYKRDKVKWVEPMLAQEDDRVEVLESMLEPNSGYYAEEKFDGTRCLMHFYTYEGDGYARLFSRRISVKTNWFSENTDSMPHLARIDVPDLAGTVIDGELFIPDRPFKDVSSTLNCKWDKAIERQIELGEIVLHAFDIIYYKGVYIARMPLWKRKQYLKKVVDMIQSPYVQMVQYSDTTIQVPVLKRVLTQASKDFDKFSALYPTLAKELYTDKTTFKSKWVLSKRAYYEYIVASGGEGIILKDKNGKYFHKRGREYTKLKKFLTREVIIMGFTEPTKDYQGKGLKDYNYVWQYWYDAEDDSAICLSEMTMKEADSRGLIPCSKFYALDWVGNIRFGVVISQKEADALLKTKKGKEFNIEHCNFFSKGKEHKVLEVGECSGFDEEMRKYLTDHQSEVMGKSN
jgi:hypothetical protein